MSDEPTDLDAAWDTMMSAEAPINVRPGDHPHDLVTTQRATGPYTEVVDGDVELVLTLPDQQVPRLRLRSDLVLPLLRRWRADVQLPLAADPTEVRSVWRALAGVEMSGDRQLEYAQWIMDLCEQAMSQKCGIGAYRVPAEPSPSLAPADSTTAPEPFYMAHLSVIFDLRNLELVQAILDKAAEDVREVLRAHPPEPRRVLHDAAGLGGQEVHVSPATPMFDDEGTTVFNVATDDLAT